MSGGTAFERRASGGGANRRIAAVVTDPPIVRARERRRLKGNRRRGIDRIKRRIDIMDTKVKHAFVVRVGLLGTLSVAALFASCASTQMSRTWTDPAAKGASISKIAVVALTNDPGKRRMFEDTTASKLAGAQAVPSYQILGDTDLKNLDAVKAKLRAAGMNGVLVMRMTGISEQVTPVGPYGTMNGYWGYAAGPAFAPGYLQTDTTVHMVSNLYSLDDEAKLIWSGVSETFNPASAESFMKGASKAVAKSLQKDHIVL
jgi:hypothetical protein